MATLSTDKTTGKQTWFLSVPSAGKNIDANGNVHILVSQGSDLLDVETGSIYTAGLVDWTPSEITTNLWLDASDTDTITEGVGGDVVAQIDDKSTNDEHFSQSTGSKQPDTNIDTINDLNVITFDGVDKFLQNLDYPVSVSGDIAVWIVAQVDAVDADTDCIFALDSAQDFQFDANDTSNFNGRINAFGIGNDLALSGGPFNGPSIYNTNFDYTTSGIYNAYVDGTKRGVDTTYSAKIAASEKFYLFRNRGGTEFTGGKFAEVIVTEDFSEDTRQKLEGYLAWKWGIESNLPSDHPYKNAKPYVEDE